MSNNLILAKEWLKSANSDLLYAKAGLRQKIIFPQVAFQSQQVVEKLLKSFLVFHKIQPLRIHELPRLLDECLKINSSFEQYRDACEYLSGFYIESRYPPDIPQYSKSDIKKAYQHASSIYKFVFTLIKS